MLDSWQGQLIAILIVWNIVMTYFLYRFNKEIVGIEKVVDILMMRFASLTQYDDIEVYDE